MWCNLNCLKARLRLRVKHTFKGMEVWTSFQDCQFNSYNTFIFGMEYCVLIKGVVCESKPSSLQRFTLTNVPGFIWLPKAVWSSWSLCLLSWWQFFISKSGGNSWLLCCFYWEPLHAYIQSTENHRIFSSMFRTQWSRLLEFRSTPSSLFYFKLIFECPKSESLYDISVTRIDGTLSYCFPQTYIMIE